MNWSRIIGASRVGKALGIASSVLVVGVWWIMSGDPGPVTATRQVPGVVLEVFPKHYVIQLDDGRKVRVFRTMPLGQGARINLLAQHHRNGQTFFALQPAGPPADMAPSE